MTLSSSTANQRATQNNYVPDFGVPWFLLLKLCYLYWKIIGWDFFLNWLPFKINQNAALCSGTQNKSWVLFGFCIIILNHNSDKAKLKWQHFFMLSKSVYEWHINQHAMSTCFYGICIITTIDATSTTSLDSLISKQSQISKQMKISKNIKQNKHTWILYIWLFLPFLGLNFVEFSKLLNEQFVIVRVHRPCFF